MKTTLIFSFLIIGACVSNVSAQWNDAGKLNVWTMTAVSRAGNSEATISLKSVRVAKNDGYDRIVFEFTGGVPRYKIKYEKSGTFMTTGEEKIKVGGKYFIDINLQSLPYPESGSEPDIKIPKGNHKLQAFNEIKEIEWFEGVREFGIGLNSKHGFRVQQLSGPLRLVIDFKQ